MVGVPKTRRGTTAYAMSNPSERSWPYTAIERTANWLTWHLSVADLRLLPHIGGMTGAPVDERGGQGHLTPRPHTRLTSTRLMVW